MSARPELAWRAAPLLRCSDCKSPGCPWDCARCRGPGLPARPLPCRAVQVPGDLDPQQSPHHLTTLKKGLPQAALPGRCRLHAGRARPAQRLPPAQHCGASSDQVGLHAGPGSLRLGCRSYLTTMLLAMMLCSPADCTTIELKAASDSAAAVKYCLMPAMSALLPCCDSHQEPQTHVPWSCPAVALFLCCFKPDRSLVKLSCLSQATEQSSYSLSVLHTRSPSTHCWAFS